MTTLTDDQRKRLASIRTLRSFYPATSWPERSLKASEVLPDIDFLLGLIDALAEPSEDYSLNGYAIVKPGYRAWLVEQGYSTETLAPWTANDGEALKIVTYLPEVDAYAAVREDGQLTRIEARWIAPASGTPITLKKAIQDAWQRPR